VSKKQITKKLVGIEEAPTFHILKTPTGKITNIPSFFTLPHSLTLLNMMMTLFTSATHIHIRSLISEMTLLYTKKTKQETNTFHSQLFAKRYPVLIAHYSLSHPKELSNQMSNKKRKNVLLLRQEFIQVRLLAHG